MTRLFKVTLPGGERVVDLAKPPAAPEPGAPLDVAGVYAASLYHGPVADTARYYSAAMPDAPAGDFALFFVTRLASFYTGVDPSVVSPTRIHLGQNYLTGSGTSGGNCYVRLHPLNSSTSASKGKVEVRLTNSSTNILDTGSTLVGSTAFAVGDTVTVVVQSVAGQVQIKTCRPGGSTVLEATATRNAAFTSKALGTWNFGREGFAGSMQAAGMVSRGLSDAEVQSLANGASPSTVVPSAPDRLALWVFDRTDATIPAAWGASAATRNGTWTSQPAASPLLRTAPNRIDVTNAPPPNGPVSPNDDGTAPTYQWSGTYVGLTPSTFQGRIENLDGTTVTDWIDLVGFAASAGTWSGSMLAPVGGPYRMQVRDKAHPEVIWRGAHPWIVMGATVSMGQSQHVKFERVVNATTTLLGTHYVVYPGVGEVVRVDPTGLGAGMIQALSTYFTLTGRSLLVIIGAVSGTSSADWAAKAANVWPPVLASLDVARPRRVLVQWENGVSENGFLPAAIKANMDTITANLDADFTTARGIAWRFKMLPHNRDTGSINNHRIRVAQYEWARDFAGEKVTPGPWWGDLITEAETVGTAQGGSSTTITLAADSTLTASATNVQVTVTGGTGAGQTRAVSAIDYGTKVATVGTAWTTAPDATSAYRTWSGDSTHADARAVGTQRFGPRYGQGLAFSFGGSAISGRGPVPATASTTGAGQTIDVVFTHRHGTALQTPNGGTSAAGVAGFEVSRDGFSTTLPIASASIVGPSTVRLVLTSAPPAASGQFVRYGGSFPVASSVWSAVGGGVDDLLYDNSGIAPTGGLPVYFSTADIAVTVA